MLHYLEREGHHFKKPLPFHFSSSPEKKYTQGVTALKIIARYWTAVITVATVDHLCPGAEAYYIQHQTTTTGATVKCSRDPHGDCDYISSILTLWGMSLGDTGTCMQTECWQHKLHILTLWGMSLGDAGTCMQTGYRQHRLHNILTLWGMSLGDAGTCMQTGCRQHRLHNILTLWGMSLGDTGTCMQTVGADSTDYTTSWPYGVCRLVTQELHADCGQGALSYCGPGWPSLWSHHTVHGHPPLTYILRSLWLCERGTHRPSSISCPFSISFRPVSSYQCPCQWTPDHEPCLF